MASTDAAFERHYTISELAELWKVSVESVRRIVLTEEDIIRLTGPSGKTSYRIPESVARRMHTKLITPRKPQIVRATK